MAGPNGSASSFALALANAVVWLVVAVGVGSSLAHTRGCG